MGEVIYTAGRKDVPPDVRFVHFNDVYNIGASEREPVGGAARFVTVVKHYRDAQEYTDLPKLLVFFSGDAYNPSLESTVTKGKHMPPILNAIGVDVSCVGNHDFDFSPENFEELGKSCHFPWLAANLYLNGKPIGGCEHTVMLTASNGIKIGLIGLVEEEWIATVNSIPPNVEYKDAAAVAKEWVPKLREQGAEMVVCISHAREPNDIKLAKALPEGLVDIILGGHDHMYNLQVINGTPILRSGTDFKNLSYLEARRKLDSKGWDFDITRRDITSDIREDEEASRLVDELTAGLKAKMSKPIGLTSVPLDSRFTVVRTEESNIGNFACDVMRYYYNADCVVMASGTIRGDVIYEAGIIRIKDMFFPFMRLYLHLLDCFPFQDPCVVIRISGKDIITVLENAFSKVPALEGRFPQVSGMIVTYDPDAEPNHRVRDVTIGGASLDLDKYYSMATREYMQRGKEGFDVMQNCEVLVNDEAGILISTLLRQYFLSLKILGSWTSSFTAATQQQPSKLHPSTHTAKRFQSLQKHHSDKDQLDVETSASLSVDGKSPLSSPMPDEESQKELDELKRKVGRKWERLAGLENHGGIGDGEEFTVHKDQTSWCKSIAPVVEGRIKVVKTAS